MEMNMFLSRLSMLNTYYTLGLYMYVMYFIFYAGLINVFKDYPWAEYALLCAVGLNYTCILVIVYTSWIASVGKP